MNDVPSWIEAVATVFAFGAATAAAIWTAKTAGSAKSQAESARKQLEQSEATTRDQMESMRTQLTLAHESAEREKQGARESEYRFLRAQFDALAPVVYAYATPGSPSGRPMLTSVTIEEQQANPDALLMASNAVTTPIRVESADNLRLFAVTVTVNFVNCSGFPARIDLVDTSNLEIDNSDTVPDLLGRELVLPPNSSRRVVLFRRHTSTEIMRVFAGGPEVQFVQLKYWVRDLAMNTQDEYGFMLEARFFTADGSRLIVEPTLPYPWEEVFAGQSKPRIYERLDAPATDHRRI